jgi:hypothetical protein
MAGFRVRLHAYIFTSAVQQERSMCRNIRTLFNFEPPATEDEIRASALQFVRKLSGFNVPSKANEDAFNDAVEEVSDAARRLLRSLATTSPPRDRAIEAEKARARARERFA